VLLGDGLFTPEFCRQLPALFDPIDFGFPAHGGMVVDNACQDAGLADYHAIPQLWLTGSESMSTLVLHNVSPAFTNKSSDSALKWDPRKTERW
jgi:hypothetical protein